MTLCSVGGATCIATGSVMQMSVTCDGVPTLLVQTFSCSHCIHTHIHTCIYTHTLIMLLGREWMRGMEELSSELAFLCIYCI